MMSIETVLIMVCIIRVGAGDKILRKMGFSTYGSMIHLQAWGDDVVSTGGGNLYDGGPNCNYMQGFNGTSSATPIVAVQSWYKKGTGNLLSPIEMRKLLIETGTAQRDPENGHIGPMLNIRNAINKLRDHLTPLPVRAMVTGPRDIISENECILSGETFYIRCC